MKVVALVSGGKDSCYNMQLCQAYGHEIVALANLLPLHDAVDESDSYMYQTVGHQIVAAFAQCMGLPLFRRRIHGSPRAKNLRYSATEGDEVEDLEFLLREVKSRVPGLGGVSTGAIASDYQRLRVENVCSRLGIVSLAYMWKQEQASLLQNMIDSGLQAVVVKVAAMGLDPHKHLGKDVAALQPLFLKLQDLYGCNVCGEGGEYESLTLDCPLFKNAKIVLDEFTVQLHSPDTIAPVGVLHPEKFHLEYKSLEPDLSLPEMVFDVTNDFVSNDHKSDLPAEIEEITGSMPSTQSEFLTTVSKQRHGFVAISCWQKVDQPLKEVQCELGALLREIGKSLKIEKLCWADVLYVHLYLNDMKDFSRANEIYMQHITEKDSVRGVPTRCCVEIPLGQAGMGQTLIEILAVTDQSKNVLHVQSISSWAPCCIGPYSQASQHRSLMYMAGQIGLDPPTMTLVPGGAACEMAQALKNCEAVAGVFTTTFLSSVLSFVVYCALPTGVKGMLNIDEILEKYLSSGNFAVMSCQGYSLRRPLVLYVLLPSLPKGALVEVAPLTYLSQSSYDNYSDPDQEANGPSWQMISKQSLTTVSAGVQESASCKALILPGHLCRTIAFLSSQLSNGEVGIAGASFYGKISLEQTFILLSNVLAQAALSWADVFIFRVYFVVEKITVNYVRKALGAVMKDSQCILQPTFVPVLGIGGTAELQDLVAVELTASGGH